MSTNKLLKRSISYLLAFIMIFSFFPSRILANEIIYYGNTKKLEKAASDFEEYIKNEQEEIKETEILDEETTGSELDEKETTNELTTEELTTEELTTEEIEKGELIDGGIEPIPSDDWNSRTRALNKWKILELRNILTGQPYSHMQINDKNLDLSASTNPLTDDYTIKASMQYTQMYDIKLYKVDDANSFNVPELKEDLPIKDYPSPAYSGYTTNVNNGGTKTFADLDDYENTYMTQYKGNMDYDIGDVDDPRGDFVGYLMINGLPAKDIVLAGYDGDVVLNSSLYTINGDDFSAYPQIISGMSKEDRLKILKEQIDNVASTDKLHIVVEKTSSGSEGWINHIPWTGYVYNDQSFENGESVDENLIALPEPNSLGGVDADGNIFGNGQYVLVVEPRGLDIVRYTTRAEGSPPQSVERRYPGAVEDSPPPAQDVDTVRFNRFKHYQLMTAVHLNFDDIEGDLGNPEHWILDPVNVLNGNFYWRYEDFKLAGKNDLTFARHYNSKDREVGAFGKGFRHEYQYEIDVDDFTAKVKMNDGFTQYFMVDYLDADVYNSTREKGTRLIKSGTDYVLETNNGLNYIFDNEKLLEIKYLDQTLASLSYNGDKLTKVQNSSGYFDLEYSGDYISKVKDNAGREVNFLYNGNLLEKSQNPDGDWILHEYDNRDNMKRIHNFEGDLFLENLYNEDDRVIAQSMADVIGVSTIHYDFDKKVNTVKYPDGSIEKYYYNDKRELLVIEYEDGGKVDNTYLDGNLIEAKDPEGNVTRYEYDDRDRVEKVIYPNNGEVEVAYTAEGLLKKMIYPDSTSMEYTYDAKGNITAIKDQRGNTESFIYDGNGYLLSHTDREGNTTQYVNSTAGIPIEVKDVGTGITQRYEYDNAGRAIKETSHEGKVIEYEYSDVGKLLKQAINGVEVTEYDNNKQGYVNKTTDPLGYESSSIYNSLNLVKESKDKLGNVTKYEYAYVNIGLLN